MTVLPFADRFRCNALVRSTGERCRNRAHPGASVCVKHGAAAPQVRLSARRRLEEQRVQHEIGRLMAELEAETLTERHPVDVLSDAVARADALAQVLGAVVGRLDPTSSWETSEQVGLYATALERMAKLSKLALDAGIEERRVVVEEDKVALMVILIRGVIVDLGHSMADPKVEAIVRKRLRMLSEPQSPIREVATSE